jgi:hypothetical protein
MDDRMLRFGTVDFLQGLTAPPPREFQIGVGARTHPHYAALDMHKKTGHEFFDRSPVIDSHALDRKRVYGLVHAPTDRIIHAGRVNVMKQLLELGSHGLFPFTVF